MKVYQIFRASGEYEDYHRYAIKTYLHKSKAETELQRLIAEIPKCDKCPYGSHLQTKKIEPDCPHFKLKVWEADEYDDEEVYDCENMLDDYDIPSFSIEEIEVDESEV